MVALHFLDSRRSSTFQEFIDNVFLPYLSYQLCTTKWLDVVWDTYIADSLKPFTRERQGKGFRQKVEKNSRMLNKWPEFLQDPKNKKGLTMFLKDAIVNAYISPDKVLVVTAHVDHYKRNSWIYSRLSI